MPLPNGKFFSTLASTSCTTLVWRLQLKHEGVGMRRVFRLNLMVLGLTALAMTVQPAGAQVVYDGGAPTGAGGFLMGSGISVAQGFTLASPTAFNQVRFWALTRNDDESGFAGPLNYTVYQRSGSGFGSVMHSGSVSIAGVVRQLDAFGFFDSYRYDFGVGNLSLGTGDYFLELSVGSVLMGWERTNPRTDPALSINPSDFPVISDAGVDFAFQLRNVTTVPEPSTAALLAAGILLLGVGPVRRRLR